jgi:hypothetical protein
MTIYRFFPALAGRAMMHLVCPISRTNLYNMICLLLSVILAAILIANPRIRSRIAPGAWTRSGIAGGDFSIARERFDQSRMTSPVKPILVVVLPDGTIVTPTAAGRL